MYEAVECFWVEPTGKAIRTLRRYRGRVEDGSCEVSSSGYHNSYVEIGEDFDAIWAPLDEDGGKYLELLDADNYRTDPRWPRQCACGYEYVEEDHWQVNQEPIYEAIDGRRAWIAPVHGRQPTPGAMFDTTWRPGQVKEDGLCISVICPDGTDWCIDGEASSGGFWERQGTPPALTVTPSIQTPGYHGHLQNGILTAG